jgi:uncharacterized protein (TIGR02285 family)
MHFCDRSEVITRITFALLMFFMLPVAQAESIVWTATDAPPFHIFSGKYASQGVCDLLIKDVSERLPQFEHEVLQLPQARMDRMLQSGQHMCFPCLIKKEQDPYFVYSDTINMREPHRLILNETAYREIKQQYGERVSLAKLLADENYRFGYPSGRKYGQLQDIIEKFGTKGYNKLSLPVEKSVIELVSMGRLDYTIDYEMVANYFRQVKGETLYLLEIEENYQQQITGAIGCTKSAWGNGAIDAINGVLPDVLSDSAYKQSLYFWFGESLIYPQAQSRE